MIEFIKNALAEDVGEGDHTSLSCVPSELVSTADLLVKENGVLAGIECAKNIFAYYDNSLHLEPLLVDGDVVSPGDVAFTVKGSARSILATERLVLNVMQRMSGVATTTARYVESIRHTKARILDTRKTTPGMRLLEKQAVLIGGGINHRVGLFDMILIKDNHVDAAGGMENAIERSVRYRGTTKPDLKIEVEVRSMDELEIALKYPQVDRIMLDNFSPDETAEAVNMVSGQCEVESSGGITLDTIVPYAEAGVDYISVGALTHSVKSMDLSLKIQL